MARGTAYAVFALPVAFTVIFSSVVLASALDELGREINMWPAGGASHGGSLDIAGLQPEYAESDRIAFQLDVSDPAYNCGDLRVIVYDSEGNSVYDELRKSTCFLEEPPGEFSITDASPGSYTVTVTINKAGEELLTSAVFQVR